MARVLIVEDEPNMRKVLSANLRQDGHVLVEAATVKEGLRAVNGGIGLRISRCKEEKFLGVG